MGLAWQRRKMPESCGVQPGVPLTAPAESRRPLGVYNFSGDLGKAVLPALIALLLPLIAWRSVLGMLALPGIALLSALIALAPNAPIGRHAPVRQAGTGRGRGGFGILAAIGALDNATRMGYLLCLPFLIHGHGGDSPTVGVALARLFIGGDRSDGCRCRTAGAGTAPLFIPTPLRRMNQWKRARTPPSSWLPAQAVA